MSKSAPYTARGVCPVCHKAFSRVVRYKPPPTFCSRGCASTGSVTPYRRRRAQEHGKRNLPHNASTTAAALRSREAWRYEQVQEFLACKNVKHQFELPLGNFIYDLGLLQHKILVEFDGKDHTYESQRRLDERKDRYALNLGWTVKRVVVAKGAVISPVVLSGIVA